MYGLALDGGKGWKFCTQRVFFFLTKNAVKTHAQFIAVNWEVSGVGLWYKTCPTVPPTGGKPHPLC